MTTWLASWKAWMNGLFGSEIVVPLRVLPGNCISIEHFPIYVWNHSWNLFHIASVFDTVEIPPSPNYTIYSSKSRNTIEFKIGLKSLWLFKLNFSISISSTFVNDFSLEFQNAMTSLLILRLFKLSKWFIGKICIKAVTWFKI